MRLQHGGLLRSAFCILPCILGLLLTALCLKPAAAGAADAPSLELVQTIVLKGKVGGLDHLTLDTKRERLFLANKANNTLDVVDLKAGKLLKQIVGQGEIQGLAYAADLDRVYAGLGTGVCNVFEGENYRPIKTIQAEDSDNVRYDPKTQRVYVAHAEKALLVFHGKTFKRVADIKLPGAAEGFQLEKGRPRLYLNAPPNQVVVIDTEKNEVLQKAFELKGGKANFPMALAEDQHRLFIGCRKDEPVVIVMDSETGKEITSVPIGADVDDLFYDAQRKRLYASCGEGVVSVIQQVDVDTYKPLDKVATAPGGRTAAFDPKTGKLYVAVARQEGKDAPEIQVYQARP